MKLCGDEKPTIEISQGKETMRLMRLAFNPINMLA
jgi:hypothetical protein